MTSGALREQLGEQEAALLAAGEGVGVAVEVGRFEAQPGEHAFDLVIQLEGVVVAEQFGEPVEPWR